MRAGDAGDELARLVHAARVEAVADPGVLRRAIDTVDSAWQRLDARVGSARSDERSQGGRECGVGRGAIEARAEMRAQVEQGRAFGARAGRRGEQRALEPVQRRSGRRARREHAGERRSSADAYGGPSRTTPSSSAAAGRPPPP